MLYGMIPTVVAMILNALGLLLSLYLSYRHHSEPLAILSIIAGVLVPLLVKSESVNVAFLVGYEVLLYGLFLLYAIKRHYLTLYYTAAILFQIVLGLTYLFLGYMTVAPIDKVWAIGAIVQHGLLLVTYHQSNRFMKHQMGLLFATFILTTLRCQSLFSIYRYGLIMLVFVLIYVILSAMYWEKKKDKQPVFLSLATFSLMLYFMLTIDYEQSLLPIFMLQGVVAIYIGLKASSQLQILTGLLVYIIGGFSASYLLVDGIQRVFSIGSLTWIVGLGTLYVVSLIVRKNKQKLDRLFRWDLDLRVLNTAFFGMLAIGSLIFITNVTYVATELWELQMRHMTASSVWILYAGIGLLFGVVRQYKPLRIAAIVLVFMTLIKIIIVDLPNLSIPIRAMLFIGLGVAGLVMSRIFYHVRNRS